MSVAKKVGIFYGLVSVSTFAYTSFLFNKIQNINVLNGHIRDKRPIILQTIAAVLWPLTLKCIVTTDTSNTNLL